MRVDLVARDLRFTLGQIVRGLRNGLTLHENVFCKEIDIADSGAANADIVVAHNLGAVPRYYIWNIDRAGIVYDQNKAGWTTTSMTLRCSAANAVLQLVVF